MNRLIWFSQHFLGWLVGILARTPLPFPLNAVVITIFAKIAKIQEEEAELPVGKYRSVSAYFARRLRGDARPIAPAALVAPADALCRSAVKARDVASLEVKSQRYTLEELLGESALAARCRGGRAFHFYLSPRDYHRVHAPCEGTLAAVRYIPGMLWPVNNWSLRNVDGLYVQNERVVMHFETKAGSVVLVMIGALNVGKIELMFDQLPTKTRPWRPVSHWQKTYSPPIPFQRGGELGAFHLGSAVILILEQDSPELEKASLTLAGRHLKMGEALSL